MTQLLIPGALYLCVNQKSCNYYVYFASDGKFYSYTADKEGIHHQVSPIYDYLILQNDPINPIFVLNNHEDFFAYE